MRPLRRLLNRFTPFYELWKMERAATTAQRITIAQLRLDLAKARNAAAGWEAHHKLACRQREEALGAASDDWTAEDEAWLRSLGERPS